VYRQDDRYGSVVFGGDGIEGAVEIVIYDDLRFTYAG
jgi:hypothetical protein